MIGIDDAILDKLIKINYVHLDSLKNNIKKINESIEEMDDSYNGKDVEFAFIEPVNQKVNLKKIVTVVDNYSNVLTSVKNSYYVEDSNLSTIINRTNSHI